MNLETTLSRLVGLTDRAQQIWEAEQRADEDNGYDEDDEVEGTLWLTLEVDLASPPGIVAWVCGYRVHEDEATRWAMKEIGRTPADAAQALLALMEGK